MKHWKLFDVHGQLVLVREAGKSVYCAVCEKRLFPATASRERAKGRCRYITVMLPCSFSCDLVVCPACSKLKLDQSELPQELRAGLLLTHSHDHYIEH